MTDDTNPYRPPDNTERGNPARFLVGRLAILALPPLIPLFAHVLSRTAIPSDDSPYHTIFTFRAILPTWLCAYFMPDRWLLLSRKAYLAACLLFASLIAVLLLTFLIT